MDFSANIMPGQDLSWPKTRFGNSEVVLQIGKTVVEFRHWSSRPGKSILGRGLITGPRQIGFDYQLPTEPMVNLWPIQVQEYAQVGQTCLSNAP